MTFQKYDIVLVRESGRAWNMAIFDHYDETTKEYVETLGRRFPECVLFENNEYLMGTYHNQWFPTEGEVVLAQDDDDCLWDVVVYYSSNLDKTEHLCTYRVNTSIGAGYLKRYRNIRKLQMEDYAWE